MEKLDGGVAVLYGANDAGALVNGGFVQESSFYYLTGISEPGAALNEALGFDRVARTYALPSDLTAMLQRSKKAVEPGQLEFPPCSSAARRPSSPDSWSFSCSLSLSTPTRWKARSSWVWTSTMPATMTCR
jgi:hypothetical protein